MSGDRSAERFARAGRHACAGKHDSTSRHGKQRRDPVSSFGGYGALAVSSVCAAAVHPLFLPLGFGRLRVHGGGVGFIALVVLLHLSCHDPLDLPGPMPWAFVLFETRPDLVIARPCTFPDGDILYHLVPSG